MKKYIINKSILFLSELPIYNHTHKKSNRIFWLWLQGEKKAPKIIKACLNSIKRNCQNHEIIIIKKSNMNKYIHIPPYILQKFEKKIISPIHFSDILRLELLLMYGGTWVDSTVLITKYSKIFFDHDLFFFKTNNNKQIVGSSWFITAEKENPILRTTLDLLYYFWAKNNKQYYYFLFHYLFKVSCDKYNNDFRNIPFYSNKPVHELQRNLFKPFDFLKYKYFTNLSSIHKLTRKRKPNRTKGLIYHHILEEYYEKY